MEKIRIFALQIEQPVIQNKTFVAYENYTHPFTFATLPNKVKIISKL